METAAPGRPSTDVRFFPVIFGIIHAVVDVTTVTVIFSTKFFHEIVHNDYFFLILTYDILAFSGQAVIGLIIDRFRFWFGTALLGLALPAVAVIVLPFEPLLAAVLAGLGNACFHVGAGALSLYVTPGRATAPGIFVAPGVLGLALGTYLGKGGHFIAWPFLLALGICLVVALFSRIPQVPETKEVEKPKINLAVLAVVLLLFSIVVRSLVGKAGTFACPKLTIVLFTVATAAFAGKAIGGIVSDRFGWIAISVGALLVSAPLLGVGGSNWLMVGVGMFFFQMTMPVTLVAVWSLMPRRPGLAFGLNCFALTLGALPTYLRAVKAMYGPPAFVAMILLSALSVYLGLRMLKGKVRMKFADG